VDKGDHLQAAHAPIAESHDPDACAQRLLAMLPVEVRAVILEKAHLLSYPVVKVMTSLLIAHVWRSGFPGTSEKFCTPERYRLCK
jgi:hypothetical protein